VADEKQDDAMQEGNGDVAAEAGAEEAVDRRPSAELKAILEALIFASPEPLTPKAMCKLPEERYPTAQALADDLRRYLEDKPIQARRPTVWQRMRKWARRHKAVVATACGAPA